MFRMILLVLAMNALEFMAPEILGASSIDHSPRIVRNTKKGGFLMKVASAFQKPFSVIGKHKCPQKKVVKKFNKKANDRTGLFVLGGLLLAVSLFMVFLGALAAGTCLPLAAFGAECNMGGGYLALGLISFLVGMGLIIGGATKKG